MKMETKKQYVPPTIEVTVIEMEEGLAAGSGTIRVNNSQGANGVQEEWLEDDSDNRNIYW